MQIKEGCWKILHSLSTGKIIVIAGEHRFSCFKTSSEIVQCVHLMVEMIFQVKPKLQMFIFYNPLSPTSVTKLETTFTVVLTKLNVFCQVLLTFVSVESLLCFHGWQVPFYLIVMLFINFGYLLVSPVVIKSFQRSVFKMTSLICFVLLYYWKWVLTCIIFFNFFEGNAP